MNDDYDKHIVQKYRLAVAFAIIRNTPDDSNPKLYFEHLKRSITPEMDFDSDMTICEDDFEFNDDNDEAINYNANNDNSNNEIKLIDSQTNDSVTILKDFDFNVMMQNINNEDNTETILKDFDFNITMQTMNNENNNKTENDSVSDVLRILKGVGDEELREKEVHFENSDGNHVRPTYNDDSQSLLQQINIPISGNIGRIGYNLELALSGTTKNSSKIKVNDLKNQEISINSVDYALFYDSQIEAHAHGKNPELTISGATTHNSDDQINDLNNKKNNISSFDNLTYCGSQTKGSTHESNTKSSLPETTYDNNNKMNDLKTNISSVDNVIFRDSQMETYNEYTDNFTHFSQSQVDNIVLPRYLIEKEKFKDNKSKLSDNEIKQNMNNYTNANSNTDKDKPLTNIVNRNNENINKIHGNTEVIIINDVNIINDKKHKFASQDSKTDRQAKRSRNLDKNVHSDTDIAYYKDMKNKFNITSSFDSEMSLNYNLKSRPNRFRNVMKSDNIVNSQEFTDTNDTDFNRFDNDLSNNNTSTLDKFGSQFSIKSSNPNKIAYGSQGFSQHSFEFDTESSTVDTTMTSQVAKQKFDSESSSNVDALTSHIANTAAKEDSEEEIEELFEELTDSQAEAVPFKVLEELNKVKSFLNKRNRGGNSGYASDSGYRSDSQSRSSFRSALQPNGLNQSAHCLLTYLTTGPMAVNTEDITNEISRTLGHLIDRLHEQEKCPSFLEEHLLTVDRLLKEVYEEESDDMVMEKEERIHRIFLLNKSSHIIKHTAEKILVTLEHILTILTENEPLEVSRTIHIENLAYIFHVLETLIKKLLVYKSLSQSTQNSQEDEVILKRSSITDIWRKKWNPTKKSDPESSGSVKQCVLIRCSEVLNKLIVNAMDGYSLISYFALQCFNLLQN